MKKLITAFVLIVFILAGYYFFSTREKSAELVSVNSSSEEKSIVEDVSGVEFVYPRIFGTPAIQEGNSLCPEEDTYRTPETLAIFDREFRFPDADLAETESFIRFGIRFYELDPLKSSGCNDEVLRNLALKKNTGQEFSSFKLSPVDTPGFYGVHNEQASRLDTESREQYTFFTEGKDGKILVIQPYMSFIPYYNSPERIEIEESFTGNINEYVQKGQTAKEIRNFLSNFRTMVESIRM